MSLKGWKVWKIMYIPARVISEKEGSCELEIIWDKSPLPKNVIISESCVIDWSKGFPKNINYLVPPTYKDFNWIKFFDQPLWKPLNDKIEICTSPNQFDPTKPQCVFAKNKWLWYYNYLWALQEVKMYKAHIPTLAEFYEISKILDPSLVNFRERNQSNSTVRESGKFSINWSVWCAVKTINADTRHWEYMLELKNKIDMTSKDKWLNNWEYYTLFFFEKEVTSSYQWCSTFTQIRPILD